MENWVLRFSSLKRLYRLITQYYADVLHQPASALEVPDLQAVAKDYNVPETLRLCRLTIGIAVQSDKKKEVVESIQGLNESHQSSLMRAIEKVRRFNCEGGGISAHSASALKVMSKLAPLDSIDTEQQRMTEYVSFRGCLLFGFSLVNRDDHYYQIQSERSRILVEKEALDKAYQHILNEHRTLQTNFVRSTNAQLISRH